MRVNDDATGWGEDKKTKPLVKAKNIETVDNPTKTMVNGRLPESAVKYFHE